VGAAGADASQAFGLFGGQIRGLEQLGLADDRVHRGADVVADVGEELGLGAFGGLGLSLCVTQLALGLARLCHVLHGTE